MGLYMYQSFWLGEFVKMIPEFTLRIPTAHGFFVISACVENIRYFPQTELKSEIKAPFLLNEHGDPHFLCYKFNENNIRHNWEKIGHKSMATFLANQIIVTVRDVTGPPEQVQIMFTLRDKNIN